MRPGRVALAGYLAQLTAAIALAQAPVVESQPVQIETLIQNIRDNESPWGGIGPSLYDQITTIADEIMGVHSELLDQGNTLDSIDVEAQDINLDLDSVVIRLGNIDAHTEHLQDRLDEVKDILEDIKTDMRDSGGDPHERSLSSNPFGSVELGLPTLGVQNYQMVMPVHLPGGDFSYAVFNVVEQPGDMCYSVRRAFRTVFRDASAVAMFLLFAVKCLKTFV
jgi:hypothetical protein